MCKAPSKGDKVEYRTEPHSSVMDRLEFCPRNMDLYAVGNSISRTRIELCIKTAQIS